LYGFKEIGTDGHRLIEDGKTQELMDKKLNAMYSPTHLQCMATNMPQSSSPSFLITKPLQNNSDNSPKLALDSETQ